MIQIKLERDPALVVGPCLRVRTRRAEWFLWWQHRPRLYRWDRRDEV